MCYMKLMQWLGGKFRMLPQFLSMIEECEEYYELFIGSGAVFLNKEPSDIEVICDADSGIAILWKVLGDSDCNKIIYNTIMNLNLSKEQFDELIKMKKLGYKGLSEIEIAVITYYLTVYSFDSNRKNMRNGNFSERWDEMEDAVKRNLEEDWERITRRASNAIILNEDALKVLAVIKDRTNALILLDPPYVPELLGTCKHLYEVRFDEDKQIEMLKLIQDAKAKIILCGYRGASFLYDRYLNKDNGWHCYLVDGEILKACQNTENKDFAQEFVWTNYELPDKAKYAMCVSDWVLTQAEADMLKEQWELMKAFKEEIA